MKAHVWVMLKSTVLDPQGQTIERALASLGYEKVQNVRQGKFFVLDLDGLSRADAQTQVERIAKDVRIRSSAESPSANAPTICSPGRSVSRPRTSFSIRTC